MLHFFLKFGVGIVLFTFIVFLIRIGFTIRHYNKLPQGSLMNSFTITNKNNDKLLRKHNNLTKLINILVIVGAFVLGLAIFMADILENDK